MSEKIKPIPHKHAAVIKAWADGHVVQLQRTDGTWVDLEGATARRCIPSFDVNWEYRIKPEPTDLEKYGVEVGDVWSLLSGDLVLVESVGVELFEGRSLRIGAGQIFRRNSNCSTLIFRRGEVNKL